MPNSSWEVVGCREGSRMGLPVLSRGGGAVSNSSWEVGGAGRQEGQVSGHRGASESSDPEGGGLAGEASPGSVGGHISGCRLAASV